MLHAGMLVLEWCEFLCKHMIGWLGPCLSFFTNPQGSQAKQHRLKPIYTTRIYVLWKNLGMTFKSTARTNKSLHNFCPRYISKNNNNNNYFLKRLTFNLAVLLICFKKSFFAVCVDISIEIALIEKFQCISKIKTKEKVESFTVFGWIMKCNYIWTTLFSKVQTPKKL